jgi:hypothetical protein
MAAVWATAVIGWVLGTGCGHAGVDEGHVRRKAGHGSWSLVLASLLPPDLSPVRCAAGVLYSGYDFRASRSKITLKQQHEN